MTQSLRIVVFGTPIPKGSTQIVTHRAGGVPLQRPLLVQANSHKLESWSKTVAGAALAARARLEGFPISKQALRVGIVFRLRRPESHFGARGLRPSAPPWPSSKPDIDKLARSTLDPLTGIVYDDDARIVELSVRKVYCAGAGEVVGAVIDVEVVETATLLLPLPVVDDRDPAQGEETDGW